LFVESISSISLGSGKKSSGKKDSDKKRRLEGNLAFFLLGNSIVMTGR